MSVLDHCSPTLHKELCILENFEKLGQTKKYLWLGFPYFTEAKIAYSTQFY
jgi:hypothetical protein